MGRKSKNKKQLTITLPEDLPPPILTKEVDTPKDSRSPTPSPSLSPTGSVSSSTSSLLSIGPPPYVKPPKKLGASKSAVESFVASSTAALHEEFTASAWDFPVPDAVVAKPAKKDVGKAKTAPKSNQFKDSSTSKAVPVAGSSKKARSPSLPKLAPAVWTPTEATTASKKSAITGASSSKSTDKTKDNPTLGKPSSSKTPAASTSKKVPATNPSPTSQRQHPDTSKKSPLTKKSKAKANQSPVVEPVPQKQVPTPSKKKSAADLPEKSQDVDSDASRETAMPDLHTPGPSHAIFANKRQLVADLPVELSVPETSEKPCFRSLADDMEPASIDSDDDENPKKELAGTSNASLVDEVLVVSSPSSSSSASPEPSFLDMQPGEVPGFAEVGNGNAVRSENVGLPTENLPKSIDEDGAFKSLVYEDLADFPTINEWIRRNGGSTGAEEATNGTDSTSGSVNANNPMKMDEVIQLQTELESLRSCLCARVEFLLREKSRLRPVTDSERSHGRQNINADDPKVPNDPAPSTSASAQAANTGNVDGVKATAEAAASPASTSFTDTSKMGTPLKGNDSTGKRKRRVGRNFGGRKAKPRSNKQQQTTPLDYVGGEDASEKFWMFMDKFCRDITEVDVENVEVLKNEHRNLPEEVFEIPALGKHYKGGDAKSREARKKEQKLKPGVCEDVVGPATQQIVKAMVKERVEIFRVTRAKAATGDAEQKPPEETTSNRLRKLQQIVKKIRLEGAAGLDGQPSMEARIKSCMKELREILTDDEDDLPMCDPEDEILTEILRTQRALRKVHGDNVRIFAYLKRTALRELERCKWSRLVNEADRKLKMIVMKTNYFECQKLPKQFHEVTNQTLRERTKALHMLSIYEELAEKEEGFIAAIEMENCRPRPRRNRGAARGADADTAG